MIEYDEIIMANGRPLRVHQRTLCEGRHCSVHSPSDHPLNTAPYVWRTDRRLMERRCEHGIDHPDPDDLAFKKRTGHLDVRTLAEHGCDGCCRPERKPIQVEFLRRELPKKPFLLPIVKMLDSRVGQLVRNYSLLLSLICLFFTFFSSAPVLFWGFLGGGACYASTTFLVHHYKKHYSQYFRRSNS